MNDYLQKGTINALTIDMFIFLFVNGKICNIFSGGSKTPKYRK